MRLTVKQRECLAYLRLHPGARTPRIAESTETDGTQILGGLYARGLVKRVKSGPHKRDGYIWFITHEGMDALREETVKA